MQVGVPEVSDDVIAGRPWQEVKQIQSSPVQVEKQAAIHDNEKHKEANDSPPRRSSN